MAEKRNLTNTFGQANGTNQEVLAYDARRQYLLIQNKSDENLYVTFGETATLTNGLIIYPNTAYEPPYEVVSSVNMITAGLTVDYTVVTG